MLSHQVCCILDGSFSSLLPKKRDHGTGSSVPLLCRKAQNILLSVWKENFLFSCCRESRQSDVCLGVAKQEKMWECNTWSILYFPSQQATGDYLICPQQKGFPLVCEILGLCISRASHFSGSFAKLFRWRFLLSKQGHLQPW